MRMIESRDQFRQEAQTMLQDIEQRLNDFNQASDNQGNQSSQEQREEINRLKNQHRNLKEALERYGTVSEDNWTEAKQDVENIFNEADSTWSKYRTDSAAISTQHNAEQNGESAGQHQSKSQDYDESIDEERGVVGQNDSNHPDAKH